jgi:hypothetical protein
MVRYFAYMECVKYFTSFRNRLRMTHSAETGPRRCAGRPLMGAMSRQTLPRSHRRRGLRACEPEPAKRSFLTRRKQSPCRVTL